MGNNGPIVPHQYTLNCDSISKLLVCLEHCHPIRHIVLTLVCHCLSCSCRRPPPVSYSCSAIPPKHLSDLSTVVQHPCTKTPTFSCANLCILCFSSIIEQILVDIVLLSAWLDPAINSRTLKKSQVRGHRLPTTNVPSPAHALLF